MDLDLMRGKQLNLQHKNKYNKTKDFKRHNLLFGLHILPYNPKTGVFSFAISLIMLHATAGTTQQTSSPLLLPCGAEVDKIQQAILINFLKSGEE